MSSGGAEAGEPTPNDEGRLDRHLLRGNYLAAIVVAIVSVVGLMLAIGPGGDEPSEQPSFNEWIAACEADSRRQPQVIANDPDGWVNFRRAPDIKSPTIGTLLEGTTVCATTRQRGDFYWPVEIHGDLFDERTGYVHASRLSDT